MLYSQHNFYADDVLVAQWPPLEIALFKWTQQRNWQCIQIQRVSGDFQLFQDGIAYEM